ncbi:hypothetical protein quinque_006956 [Culex quinquefasciatus]
MFGQVQSRPNTCKCYRFLDVQCGTDGRSYLNKCVLACAKPYTGATLEHPGYCEETTNEYDVVGENFDPERIGWGK